jgi:MFS family permease
VSCLYLGLVAGPVAGGWLAGHVGWRAVFVMEVPLAIAASALASIFIPRSQEACRQGRYHLAGAGVWVFGLASFVWVTRRNLPRNIGATWVAVAGLALLVVAALTAAPRQDPDAWFPVSALRNRRFTACALSLMIAFAASYMLTFTLAFLLVDTMHESASAAGGMLAVYALARASIAWLSGRWSDQVDVRLLTTSSLLLFACGVAALSGLIGSSGVLALAAALVAAGVGFGAFVPPNNNALMGSASPDLYGFAAGILATARTVGMTVGVALSGALLSTGSGPLAGRAILALRAAAVLSVAGAIVSALGRGRELAR